MKRVIIHLTCLIAVAAYASAQGIEAGVPMIKTAAQSGAGIAERRLATCDIEELQKGKTRTVLVRQEMGNTVAIVTTLNFLGRRRPDVRNDRFIVKVNATIATDAGYSDLKTGGEEFKLQFTQTAAGKPGTITWKHRIYDERLGSRFETIKDRKVKCQ